MKRISLLPFVVCGFLLVWMGGGCRNTETTSDPNIILISLDTCRADRLSFYGNTNIKLPIFSELLNDSVLFKNAFTHASYTLPAHISIFSAEYPGRYFRGFLPWAGTKFAPVDFYLNENKLTELLKKKGYKTYSVNEGGYVGREYGFSQGFDEYVSLQLPEQASLSFPLAIEKLNHIQKEKFFFFIHTYEMHDPFKRGYYYAGKTGMPNLHDYWRNFYDGGATQCDRYIGLLIDALKRLNLYDRTLLIVLSDHGEEIFDKSEYHALHGHCLYDYILHIPLVIKFPNSEFCGKVVDPLVRLVDIMPTLADYLQIDLASDSCAGESLLPLLEERETEERFLYAGYNHQRAVQYCIRTSQYKLIHTPHAEEYTHPEITGYTDFWNLALPEYELYDLINDPTESVNLFDAKPDTAQNLFRLLKEFRSRDIPQVLRVEDSNRIVTRKYLHLFDYASLLPINKSGRLTGAKSSYSNLGNLADDIDEAWKQAEELGAKTSFSNLENLRNLGYLK